MKIKIEEVIGCSVVSDSTAQGYNAADLAVWEEAFGNSLYSFDDNHFEYYLNASEAARKACCKFAKVSGTAKVEVETASGEFKYGSMPAVVKWSSAPSAIYSPIKYKLTVIPEIGDCGTETQAERDTIALSNFYLGRFVDAYNHYSSAQYDATGSFEESAMSTPFSNGTGYFEIGGEVGDGTDTAEVMCCFIPATYATAEYKNLNIRIRFSATYDNVEYPFSVGFYLPTSDYSQKQTFSHFLYAKRTYNEATGKYVYEDLASLASDSNSVPLVSYSFDAIYGNAIAMPTDTQRKDNFRKKVGYLPTKFALWYDSTVNYTRLNTALSAWNADNTASVFEGGTVSYMKLLPTTLYFDKAGTGSSSSEVNNGVIIVLYEPIKITYKDTTGTDTITERQIEPDANNKVKLLAPEDYEGAATNPLADVVTSVNSQITVIFDPNDGELDSSLSPDAETGKLTKYIPYVTTQAFAGWNEEPNKQIAISVDAEGKLQINANNTKDMTLYAVFNSSSAYGKITMPTAQYVARSGYEFAGWYTAATGGERVTADENGQIGAATNITLYAHWRAIRFIPHIIVLPQGTTDIEDYVEDTDNHVAIVNDGETISADDLSDTTIDMTTPHWRWIEATKTIGEEEVTLKSCAVVLGTAYNASTATSGWTVIKQFNDETDANNRLLDYAAVLYQPSTKTILALAVPATGYDEGMEDLIAQRTFGTFLISASNRTTPLTLNVAR